MHIVEEAVFYGFNFRCEFRSYEKSEQIVTVVLNGSNGQVQTNFFEAWQKIIPSEERNYTQRSASQFHGAL